MGDDLVEKVARAICNDGHGRLTWDELPESRRDAWRKMARAAIAVCMEEAAIVADAFSESEQIEAEAGLAKSTGVMSSGWIEDGMHSRGAETADKIAAAIRALASEKARADRAEIANQIRDVSLGWKVRAEAAEAELAKLRETSDRAADRAAKAVDQYLRAREEAHKQGETGSGYVESGSYFSTLDNLSEFVRAALRPTTSEEGKAG